MGPDVGFDKDFKAANKKKNYIHRIKGNCSQRKI